MYKIFYIALILLTANASFAKTLYYEKDYQKVWCSENGGQTEVVLADKTRVDCVTEAYAIEFDFAKKWGESIGQALYYGLVLNKKPGIVLIIENPKQDYKYVNRVTKVAQQHNIKLWTITPNDLSKYVQISSKSN